MLLIASRGPSSQYDRVEPRRNPHYLVIFFLQQHRGMFFSFFLGSTFSLSILESPILVARLRKTFGSNTAMLASRILIVPIIFLFVLFLSSKTLIILVIVRPTKLKIKD